jgi:hypothetical protein
MLLKHHAQGKFYLIACPEASRLVLRSHRCDCHGNFLPDLIIVPHAGREIPIRADPPALLPLLAEAGQYGLSLVGPPRPDATLTGACCPRCGESDVAWLSIADGAGPIHCDSCGADFGPPIADRIIPERDDNPDHRDKSREPRTME